MEINKNVIHRNVAGEDILIPVGNTAKDYNGLFVLTPIGAEIWKMLGNGKELDEIVEVLVDTYDASPDVIYADTVELIDRFKELGLVEA